MLFRSRNRLDELVRSDLSSIVKHLEGTPYGETVKDAISSSSSKHVEALQVMLDRILMDEIMHASNSNPLSLNSSLSFLKKKEGEVTTLRAIVAGKWFDLEESEIRGMIS